LLAHIAAGSAEEVGPGGAVPGRRVGPGGGRGC
jgi:hypothetical protein